MKAEIITIGDEILIGQIVDTNSAWMARQLNLAGIEIYQVTSVHDDHGHILRALQEAGARAKLVLITGGLGPTKDDITKNTLCEYFGAKLVYHEAIFEQIVRRFERRGIRVSDLNREQAMLPDNCTMLPNVNGTAPGMWFEKEGVIYISMPGVPFEMEAMMTGEILPRLKALGKAKTILHRTILTQGIPESVLAERLASWEDQLPPHLKLAYLPNPMAVRLRLSAYGQDENRLKADLVHQESLLLPMLGDAVYGFDDETMSSAVGRLLKAHGQTMAVAESCTGGNISHLVTLTPGSSAWYRGGVTAYANEVKSALLGVSPETLSAHGAVSSETALEMAQGVRKALGADYSIATTGVAGPDGGTPEKPVGTVWISIAGPTKFLCEKYVFGMNRERNILRSSQTALQMLRKLIVEDHKTD